LRLRYLASNPGARGRSLPQTLGLLVSGNCWRRERCVRVAPAYVVSLNLKRCRRQEWQDSWLEPGRHRRIFDGCSISDQLSWRGKIPELAGGSIFCGPMVK